MQEVLSKLEKVQEIDLQINEILRKKAEYPQKLAALQSEIQSLNIKNNEKKVVFDDLLKSKRQQLGALELNEERLKRSQERSEQIKNNNEFQAITKEIESLKKNSAVIKENADKVSADCDLAQKELDQIQGKLDEVKKVFTEESQKIDSALSLLEIDLTKLQGVRKENIVGIDARYLATYDRLRMGKFGLGLSIASGGICRGCNMRIPPQTYNELQRGTEMHVCANCRRILVYKDKV